MSWWPFPLNLFNLIPLALLLYTLWLHSRVSCLSQTTHTWVKRFQVSKTDSPRTVPRGLLIDFTFKLSRIIHLMLDIWGSTPQSSRPRTFQLHTSLAMSFFHQITHKLPITDWSREKCVMLINISRVRSIRAKQQRPFARVHYASVYSAQSSRCFTQKFIKTNSDSIWKHEWPIYLLTKIKE